jgi:acetolactate synthase-1/2/3 large subunit
METQSMGQTILATENEAASRSKERLTGAQVLVRLLERQGVRMIAGIPGGAILPFYDALSHSTRIVHVLARHEQGAGFIAQGWALSLIHI